MPGRRTATAIALALAASAAGWVIPGAASAATKLFSWDDAPLGFISNAYPGSGISTDSGCEPANVVALDAPAFPAHSPNQAVLIPPRIDPEFPCPPRLFLSLDPAQFGTTRALQFWARPAAGRPGGTIKLFHYLSESTPPPILRTIGTDWTRLTYLAPTGPGIQFFMIEGYADEELYLDDLATSDVAQVAPTTTIDRAPADPTTGGSEFLFHGSDPTATYSCQLDALAPQPCGGGRIAYDAPPGPHQARIQATSYFGIAELKPPTHKWTVVAPPPPPPAPAPDLCASGPDSDSDGVVDACDTVGLPATIAPEQGVSARIKVVSGEVFIRLPGGQSQRLGLARRAANGLPGFVPLKGAANVPVGSTVDAQNGAIELVSATGSKSGTKAAPTATGRLSSAIFQIRQRRAANKAKAHKKLPPRPTDIILRSPDAAIAAARCASKGSTATVRALSAVVPKGAFNFVGAAASVTTTGAQNNVRTSDRCDGTYTEVGRGTAVVRDKRRHKTVKVRAGQAFLVRAPFRQVEGLKGR